MAVPLGLELSPEPGGRVAVIIPARDAEQWIEQCIASALAQPETCEVVVIDDGSRDRTAALAAGLADRDARVICLRAPGAPVGPGAARNLGVRASSADVLAFLDADDYLLPGAFSAAFGTMADTSVDVVLSAISILSEDPEERLARRVHDPVAAFSSKGWLRALCEGSAGIPVCSALLRRTAFSRVGGFDEALPLGQDLVLWLKVAVGSMASISEAGRPVAVYRRHRGNRSCIDGHGPVQAGLWACVHAWRWSLRTPDTSEGARDLLLRGAGLRQRQMLLRALQGNRKAGMAALVNAAKEPRILFNHGFWSGAAAIVRS